MSAAQHTPTPWSVDSTRNEGEYGDGGPDPRSGFDSFVIMDSEGRVLFDSLNRDGSMTEITEEGDSYEGHFHAWDAAAKRDAEHVVRCVNAHADLLAALQWSEQFNRRPGEGWNECFERVAEIFHRETGHLRPGKDASPMAGASMDERQAAWDEWIAAGIARTRAAIAKATGAAS